MLRLSWIVLAVALVAGPALAGSADLAGARAFVQALYAQEMKDANWDRHLTSVFDASLAAAIKTDEAITEREGGDDGEGLDYDPFCQCQDQGGLNWRIVSLVETGPATAKAAMSITWPGPPGPAQTPTLLLVKTGAGWRVHDVATKDTPSLLAQLQKANRKRGGK